MEPVIRHTVRAMRKPKPARTPMSTSTETAHLEVAGARQVAHVAHDEITTVTVDVEHADGRSEYGTGRQVGNAIQ